MRVNNYRVNKIAQFMEQFVWNVIQFEKEGDGSFTPCVVYINKNGGSPRAVKLGDIDTGVPLFIFHDQSDVYAKFASVDGVLPFDSIKLRIRNELQAIEG